MSGGRVPAHRLHVERTTEDGEEQARLRSEAFEDDEVIEAVTDS
jgi:hypothetical protein